MHALSFLKIWRLAVALQSLNLVQLFWTPWTAASPGVYSNSCPLSWWCHPTISSSVTPFSCPLSFPASGSFQMSWLLTSGGQSTRASASACLSNEYSGLISFRIDWFDLLAVQGTLKNPPAPQLSILFGDRFNCLKTKKFFFFRIDLKCFYSSHYKYQHWP